MKLFRIILCCCTFFFLLDCARSRQLQTPAVPVVTTEANVLTGEEYPDFLSNYARIFIHSLSQEVPLCSIPPRWIPSETLINRFPIAIMEDSIFCVSGFLEVDPDFNLNSLKQLGIYFEASEYPFSTAFIPLTSLCQFLKLQGIKRFELTRKGYALLNIARKAIQVQQLITPPSGTRAYKGNGIVIGIVDYGFDYTHPDFYDSTGTVFRIRKVWEQANNQGPHPTGFPYGSEFDTPREIRAAQTDTPTETHGTHVAGIAAGSGFGTIYYGVAPESELIFVSTTRTDVGIADGLRYVLNHASAVGKPCVINFSMGSQIGPHDGTSSFDRLCEQKSAPGMLFTGAGGNDGDIPLYLSNQFNRADGDTLLSSFLIPIGETNQMIADLWGAPGTQFDVAVALFDTITGQTITQSRFFTPGALKKVYTCSLNSGDSTAYIAQLATEIAPANSKPTVMVQFNSESVGAAQVPVVKIRCYNGFVEGWASYASFSNLGLSAPYRSGITTHTINEIGGTGKKIISAGAYCTKNTWTDLSGGEFQYGPGAVLGEIGPFSAKGPTADGRIKPDITCPGYGVVSAFSRYFTGSYPPSYYKVTEVTFEGINYPFGILQGTSEAAPLVAGTLALFLEEDSTLDLDEARMIIQKTATSSPASSLLGLPNNVWGWGILNGTAAMEAVKE